MDFAGSTTSRRRSGRSCATSPPRRSRRTPRPGTATTPSRSTPCWRWASSGLFGLPFPEEYGGSGAAFTTLCVAIEELGRVDQSIGITLSAGVGLGANPIFTFGTEEQRQRWLPDLVAGRALGAFGLTEPDAGSDAGGTRTKAALDEGAGEWVIDGEKAFITNSGTPITSLVTVTARTGQGEISAHRRAGRHAGARGASRRTARWAGTRPTPTASSSTTAGCPPTTCSASRAAGSATSSPSSTTAASPSPPSPSASPRPASTTRSTTPRTRNAFGGPIGRYQAVAFTCADLAVAVENARLLTYKAAWLKEQRPAVQRRRRPWPSCTPPRPPSTPPARPRRSSAATGFMDETPVARFYRDAKILEIGEGTSEIQRLVIARSLGLPVAAKG